ncbi:T9SS type A sorting domain-containing protein [Flavobacterium sp. MAH-1]|uniref:T9SS type A sorting domain-containing protein n=1 Tax=Flavobacterium agri TaxID=2743471 RepID=A0A7Y8Y3R3_9FLAO|nr:T9SS type A sorting domain-containing protein [Flavobacterium agri]NYA71961.1 T9SS type A sorting domain-containing protein [Flavobacterium agri]
MLGQRLESRTVRSGTDLTLNVSGYSIGVYIVNVRYGNKVSSFKFVKQ